MIKSLPNLYSRIGLPPEGVKSIIVNIALSYEKKYKPKKKFGENQIDEYGEIKFRDLEIPRFGLKMVQKRINRLLQKISLPDNMYGSVIGKDNILHAGQHLTQKYFLTIDLENFFSKINYRTVFRMLISHGFSYDTANVLTKLTTLKGVLPQGAPSSPVIANLVILDMIKEISTFVNPFNITFTSYLDDLCFSSKTNFKSLIPEILNMIKRNYFFPAYKKIHYRTDRCEITGLIVCGNELKIISEMRTKAYTNTHLNAYVKRVEKYNQAISNKSDTSLKD